MSPKQPINRQNLYLGKAGHFAVMAECLHRGFNVAVPEVDIGDDLFVINDGSGDYRRVQVKTATGKSLKTQARYTAIFRVPLSQLQTAFTPDLTYIFAVRLPNAWGPFVVIQRGLLDELRELDNVGSASDGSLVLSISYSNSGDNARCSKIDFTRFLNQFENLPEAAIALIA